MIERHNLYRGTTGPLLPGLPANTEYFSCIYRHPGRADILLTLTAAQNPWKPPTPTLSYVRNSPLAVACGNPMGESRENLLNGEGFTRSRLTDGIGLYNLSARKKGDEMVFYRQQLCVGSEDIHPFLACLQMPFVTWQFIDHDLRTICDHKRAHIVQSSIAIAEHVLSDNGNIPVKGHVHLAATKIAPLQQTLLGPRA